MSSVGGFDEATHDYVRLCGLLWDPLGERVAQAAGLQTGDRVLDACAGAGSSAIPAATLVGPTGQVDAVDLSANLLAQIPERAQAAALPAGHALSSAVPSTLPTQQAPIRTHAEDATTFGEGEQWDALVCVLGVVFFPDPTTGTRALLSRLRPGGRAAIAVWDEGVMQDVGAALFGAIQQVTAPSDPTSFDPAPSDPAASEPAPSDPAASQPAPSENPFASRDSFARWLTSHGLENVRVERVPHALSADPETAWLLVLGSGFRGMLAGLDEAQLQAVREQYLATITQQPQITASVMLGLGTAPAAAAAAPTA